MIGDTEELQKLVNMETRAVFVYLCLVSARDVPHVYQWRHS